MKIARIEGKNIIYTYSTVVIYKKIYLDLKPEGKIEMRKMHGISPQM